jgi:hypothetical protein
MSRAGDFERFGLIRGSGAKAGFTALVLAREIYTWWPTKRRLRIENIEESCEGGKAFEDIQKEYLLRPRMPPYGGLY